jgi:hypothetical protein
MPKFGWLRGLGSIGNLIANVLVFLTTNWGVVVSAVVALYVAVSDWATGIANSPTTHAVALTFLVLFWFYIGVVFLIDRNKPRLIRSDQDFAYGLLQDGVVPSYLPTLDPEKVLQFGIRFRNFTAGPLRINFEKFEVLIGTRTLPRHKGTASSLIPRGGARVVSANPFSQSDLAEYQGKAVSGTIEMSVTYGHPEKKPVRRFKTLLHIQLSFKRPDSLGYADAILEESDEPIDASSS